MKEVGMILKSAIYKSGNVWSQVQGWLVRHRACCCLDSSRGRWLPIWVSSAAGSWGKTKGELKGTGWGLDQSDGEDKGVGHCMGMDVNLMAQLATSHGLVSHILSQYTSVVLTVHPIWWAQGSRPTNTRYTQDLGEGFWWVAEYPPQPWPSYYPTWNPAGQPDPWQCLKLRVT